MKKLLILALVLVVPMVLQGCGAMDDNPVTPQKMEAMRQKQMEEMNKQAKGGPAPDKSPSGK